MPNSIADLNSFSAETITYTDNRDAKITWSGTVQNASVSLIQNQTHSMPVGVNITDIANYTACDTNYTIDLRGITGATATWSGLPGNITVTNTTAGLYTVTGINSVADWNAVKSPLITMPSTYYGSWSYTGSVRYLDTAPAHTRTWSVAVSVRQAIQLTDAQLNYYLPASVTTLTDTPQIFDELNLNPSTWTMTITANDNSVFGSMSSTGSGGTSSWNGTSKTLTISGTKTQVNSHLSAVVYTSPASMETDFVLYYSLTNSTDATVVTKTQNIYGDLILFWDQVRDVGYYTEDTVATISTGPHISDTAHDGTGSYTVTIVPSVGNAVTTMSSSGSGGTSSWNGTSKTLTLTGTRTQVNSRIDAISLTPATDYRSNFSLNYTVTLPTGGSGTRVQSILIAAYDADILNMNLTRQYLSGAGTAIFAANTPSIADSDSSNPTYTIFLSSSLGLFGDDTQAAVASYSFSGTKSQVNAKFSLIKFYPYPSIGFANTNVNSGVATYIQKKGTATMATVSFGLSRNGTGPTITGNTYVFTQSGVFLPPVEQSMYLKADILVVGVGGGGAGVAGGGGGGGAVVLASNVSLTTTGPYGFYVGSGGSGGPYTGDALGTSSDGSRGGDSLFVEPPATNTYLITPGYTIIAYGGNPGKRSTLANGTGGLHAETTIAGGTSGSGVIKLNGNTVSSVGAVAAGNTNIRETWPWLSTGAGPGGGGAGGRGGDGVNGSTGHGGNAGPGITTTITGNSLVVGGGGAGSYGRNYGSSSNSNYGGGGLAGTWTGSEPGLSGYAGQNGLIVLKFHS